MTSDALLNAYIRPETRTGVVIYSLKLLPGLLDD